MNAQLMEEGHLVEFMSDRQTDKGPSCGECERRVGNKVLIRHSDGREMFDVTVLKVKKLSRHWKIGKRSWIMH